MYRITITLHGKKTVGPWIITGTLDAIALKDELAKDPDIKKNFLVAFSETQNPDVRTIDGKTLSGSNMVSFDTYEKLIAFLGRSFGS